MLGNEEMSQFMKKDQNPQNHQKRENIINKVVHGFT
jgi:hypothetical protein